MWAVTVVAQRRCVAGSREFCRRALREEDEDFVDLYRKKQTRAIDLRRPGGKACRHLVRLPRILFRDDVVSERVKLRGQITPLRIELSVALTKRSELLGAQIAIEDYDVVCALPSILGRAVAQDVNACAP